MSYPEKLCSNLEPVALDPAGSAFDVPDPNEIQASIAISLKRIADALHGAGENGISLTAAIADIADRRGH